MRRLWSLLALALFACAPDFAEQWEVDEPRLMGARVEVEGAPTRSRPKIEERFSLRFKISLPSGNWPTPLAGRYAFDISLCLGFLSSSGVLACLGEQRFMPTVTPIDDNEVLVSGIGLDLGALAAQLGITPGEFAQDNQMVAPTDVDRLALFGVFCVDGAPERVPNTVAGRDAPSALYRCLPRPGASFTDATTFTLSVYFDRGLPTDTNQNPSFACDPAAPSSPCNAGTQVAGEPTVPGSFVIARPKKEGVQREVLAWPVRDAAAALPWDNCAADATLPQVRANSGEHTLRARFDPGDREDYTYTIPFNGVPETRSGREALTLTHAITLEAGELNRSLSKLDPEDDDAQAEISFRYTPPKKGKSADSIPDSGRLVRFYFTLRDERGGVDFTTRELCLLPALRGG
jgi:hypothetical protein